MAVKKSVKSKAVVGKKSKHHSFRLTPRIGLLSLALIAAFSFVGTLGYNKLRYGDFTASAYNWKTILTGTNNTNYGKISACKYGSTTIKVQFYHGGSTASNASFGALGVSKSLPPNQSYTVSRVATSVKGYFTLPASGAYPAKSFNGTTYNISNLPAC